ncbi:MAG: sortase domain-bontaining protein [Actinomycetes bacterium]
MRTRIAIGLVVSGLLLALVGAVSAGRAPSDVAVAPAPSDGPSPSVAGGSSSNAPSRRTASPVPVPDPHHGVVAAPVEYPDGVVPVRVVIPAIGVDAPTIDLRLSGPEPEVPTDFDDTGWYTETRRPGEVGPAVIAGHVDSRRGPAVFFDLVDLEVGDEVLVHGEDGTVLTFAVTGTGQYDKHELPPEVFGFGEPTPELRLITCGGNFDRSSGHYTDNYVVYTELVAAA